MPTKKILGHALIQAIGATAYIYFVASILANAQNWFGPDDPPKPLGTVAFLLTFVISTAIMGILIFGTPILWYLKGSKAEAIRLLFATIMFLVIIAIIVFLALIYAGQLQTNE